MTSPLTPPQCDLSDFQFMPLDVARLRDSELASSETPEACWAAVLLWAASWHQIPAASVPDDDRWLAKAAGYVARGKIDPQWNKVREGALRGFVKCDDGRLYHSVVAEKAREAWQAKLEQRWRTECARIKKHNERHGTAIERPTFEAWMSSGCPQGHALIVPSDNGASRGEVGGDKASKGQGEGQGQGQGDSSSVPNGTDGAAAPAPAKAKNPEDQAKADVWQSAVVVLQAGGCKDESTCRTFMGKLVKDYTFPVVQQAVAAAVSAQPPEAREYLKATCQRIKGERQDPVTVPSDAAAKTKADLAAMEEQARRASSPEAHAARQAAMQRLGRTPAAEVSA